MKPKKWKIGKHLTIEMLPHKPTWKDWLGFSLGHFNYCPNYMVVNLASSLKLVNQCFERCQQRSKSA